MKYCLRNSVVNVLKCRGTGTTSALSGCLHLNLSNRCAAHEKNKTCGQLGLCFKVNVDSHRNLGPIKAINFLPNHGTKTFFSVHIEPQAHASCLMKLFNSQRLKFKDFPTYFSF